MTEQKGSNVLIVDDAPENLRLLSALLKRSLIEPRPVPNGRLAIEAAVADPPDLVLLDVRMPGMSGFDVCRWFKQDERLRSIPIIFVSGLQEPEDKVEAFRMGGVDFISKPFHDQEVLARVDTHLRLRRLQSDLSSYNTRLEQQIEDQVRVITASQMATIFALAKLAETRDDDTGQHIERVQTFSRILAEQMRSQRMEIVQLTDSFIDNLFLTACLHDIGKVGTPDAVLLKPGKLTADEFEEMKKHCALGASTLASVQKRYPDNQFLRMGVDVARSHHEKWNGSGYPDGLSGGKIPLSARIVALADFYDALTSDRCYRSAFCHNDVHRMIREGSGRHFDPRIVEAFDVVEGRFKRVRHEMPDR
jgi:putative two-component system response regulator